MHSFSILTSCFRRQGVKMAFLHPWVVHFLKFANARHLQIYLNQNPNKSLVMIYISCKKPVKSHKSEKSEHLGPHLHLMLHVCAFASVCHQKNRHPKALKVETKDAGSGLGTGGMSTKILAARTASVSGRNLESWKLWHTVDGNQKSESGKVTSW